MYWVFYVFLYVLHVFGYYWCDSLQGCSLGYTGALLHVMFCRSLPQFQLWETCVWWWLGIS